MDRECRAARHAAALLSPRPTPWARFAVRALIPTAIVAAPAFLDPLGAYAGVITAAAPVLGPMVVVLAAAFYFTQPSVWSTAAAEVTTNRVTRSVDRTDAVRLVSTLGAWPQRRGHARRLFDALADAIAADPPRRPTTVLAVPATAELAATYAAHGFTPTAHPPVIELRIGTG